jgi:hypothetical protein
VIIKRVEAGFPQSTDYRTKDKGYWSC